MVEASGIERLLVARFELQEYLKELEDKPATALCWGKDLEVLAYMSLMLASNAYLAEGDEARHGVLRLAACCLRAASDPTTFEGGLLPEDMRGLATQQLKAIAAIVREHGRAEAGSEQQKVEATDILEHALVGLLARMRGMPEDAMAGRWGFSQPTEALSFSEEAQHYRYYAVLLLTISAQASAIYRQKEREVRSMAAILIVDSAEARFDPRSRMARSGMEQVAEYLDRLAESYALGQDLGFLFHIGGLDEVVETPILGS